MYACWERITGAMLLLLFLMFLAPRAVFHECAQHHAEQHTTGASLKEACSICSTPIQHFTATNVLRLEGLARQFLTQLPCTHAAEVVDVAKAGHDRGPPGRA